MASYNGVVARLNGTVTLTGGSNSYVAPIVSTVPRGPFNHALFAMKVNSINAGSTFTTRIVGAVGGATNVFSFLTNTNAVGSYVFGSTGGATYLMPRPAYVHFFIQGNTQLITDTSITMAGEYS